MKKLISLLIIFATITIACMTSVMASFAVKYTEIAKEKEIVVSNICCEGWSQGIDQKSYVLCYDLGICSDGSICECCIIHSQNYSYLTRVDNTSIKKKLKKIKILDFTFIDLLQDTLNVNFVTKLNSPPNISEPFILSNLYIALIGNVKNNC